MATYTQEEYKKRFGQEATEVTVEDDSGKILARYTGSEAKKELGYTPTGFGGKPVYQNKEGLFSITEPEEVKIDLNKDTGKITVTAPEFVRERDQFKEQYLPLLESYSANYKDNHKVTYLDEANENAKGQTTEEVLNKIQEALSTDEFIKNAKALHTLRKEEEGKTGWEFSDNDIIRTQTIAAGAEANDNSLQVVPQIDLFKNLGTYDAELGAVTRKDLLENAWNREKTSDGDIIDVYRDVMEYVDKGYKDDKSEDAKEKYIRAKAFSGFLQSGQGPNVSAIRDAGDTIGRFMYGVASTSGEVIGTITDTIAGLFGVELGFADETRRQKKTHMEETRILNPDGAALEVLGEASVHIVNSIVAGKVAAGAVGLVSNALYKVTGIAGATKALVGTEGLIEAYKKGALTAATATEIALQSAKHAAYIKPAISAILWLSNGSTVAKMVNGAVGVIGKTVSVFTDALASGILEATINNPELFQKVIKNKEVTPEAREAVMTEFAWNVGGWGAGVTIVGALSVAGETTIGRVISDNWAIVNARLQNTVGNWADAIKVRFSRYESMDELLEAMKAKNADKYQVALLNQALRSETAQLASEKLIHISDKNIKESLARVDDAIIKVRTAQNAVTVFQRGAGSVIHKWFVSDKNFRESYEAFQKNADEVTEIEKKMGLTARAVTNEDFTTSGRLFSQTTTNYIGARNEQIRVNYLISKQGETEELMAASADIQNKIEEFRKIAPEGSALDIAVNNFIVDQRKLYHNLNNLYIDPKWALENRAKIEGLRASGEWGKNGTEYAYAMRQAELSDIQIMHKNGTFNVDTAISEDRHLKYGATGDYADPILALENNLIEHARIFQRRNLYKAFGDTPFVNKIEMISAERTEMVRIVTPKVRKNYEKAILEKIRDTSETMIKDEVGDLFAKKAGELTEAKQASKTARAKAKRLAKGDARTYSAGIPERTGYIMSMSGDEVSEAMDEVYGVSDFRIFAVDEAEGTVVKEIGSMENSNFESFYGSLPRGAKTYLDRRISDFASNYLSPKEAKSAMNNIGKKRELFLRMLDESDNADDIARGILANTRTYRDSEWIQSLASAQVTDYRRAEWALKYKEEINSLVEKANTAVLDSRVTAEQIQDVIDRTISDLVRTTADTPDVVDALSPILKVLGENMDDTAKNYIVLQTMLKNRQEFRAAAADAIAKSLSKGANPDEIASLTDDLTDMLFNRAKDFYTNYSAQLQSVNSSLVDMDSIFDEIKNAAKDIKNLETANDIIIVGDQMGALQYVKVNPLFADLMNTQPAYKDMGKIAKVNYIWSKVWRMGTVNLNLTSLVNQQFKDSINAFVGGGAWHTTKTLINNLSPAFGDDIVDYFREFEPSTLEYIVKKVGDNEDEVRRLATETLLKRGKEIQEETIETSAYQMSREARFAQFVNGEDQRSRLDKAMRKLDNYMNSKWSINKINDMREGMLRSSVYANAMATGLKRGYSVEQATEFATQLMDDATTNFSRSMYHLKSLQKTVPFLGAAVNGTKSFWRLAMLDPVSVFGRLIGGAAIPTMALTAMSLGSEENREAWKNLKDYEKSGNIVFAIQGQIYTIPMPEELGAFINPFREVVEGLANESKHSFWELAANNILEISPIDLTGFTQMDAYTLLKDPTAWDRIENGVLRLAGQLLPTPLRTAAIAISGRDLYTGKPIVRADKQFNPETGEAEIMGDYSGQFAKALAALFGNDVSGEMIEAIFSNIIGKAGIDFANTLTNYGALAFANQQFQKQIGATSDFAFTMPLQRLTSPVTVSQYKTIVQQAWNDAVNYMYDEKERIKADPVYQGLVQAINDAETPQAREKATNKRNEYLKPYYDQLKGMVDRLNSVYQSEFTGVKYASILSLANFGSGLVGVGGARSALDSKELYYEGKQQAIATMERLGFKGADTGIFGTIRRNKDGENYIAYATPMAILNAENQAYYAADTYEANLEYLLDKNNISRKEMFGDTYNKVKNNKTELKQYKSAWNTKVVMALAPYIQKYGVDNVLNSTQIVDMLDQYIFVDNPWNAKQYLKTIFKGEK